MLFAEPKDYWCGICCKYFGDPGGLDHCGNCGHEHTDEVCPECGYDGEMEMTCPDCGTDGGNGGLGHTSCCESEIEAHEYRLLQGVVKACESVTEQAEEYQSVAGADGWHELAKGRLKEAIDELSVAITKATGKE